MKPILALLFLSSLAVAQNANMLTPPYLQAVGLNSICVLVETTSKDTVTVEFGPSPKLGRSATTSSTEETTEKTFVHAVKLTALQPGTRYWYRALLHTQWSDTASFMTAVPAGTPFRFAWYADGRTNMPPQDSVVTQILKHHPVVSLYGGDLCGRSTYESFKKEFFRTPQQQLIARVPFFNAPGNHEAWKENTKAFTESPDCPSGVQDYFSLDYGDLHVLVLNTQIDYKEDSPQFAFAKSDLQMSTATWKLVIAHKPAYCAGGHGEDAGMIRMTKEIFEPSGVQAVLAGHSHFYQHNLVNGIHHLVIGSAGAPLYDPDSVSYTLKREKKYDWAIGEVTPTSLTITVKDEAGNVLDEIAWKRPAKAKQPGKKN